MAGAVQDTKLREFSATVADAPVGACDTPNGIIAEEADDAEPAPDTFVAVTVNVYDTPPVRPVTVHEVVAVEHVKPPGDEVTVYDEIAAPPLDDGADQETTDWFVAPAVPETPVGATGTADGTIDEDAEDAALVPFAFVAVTVNV